MRRQILTIENKYLRLTSFAPIGEKNDNICSIKIQMSLRDLIVLVVVEVIVWVKVQEALGNNDKVDLITKVLGLFPKVDEKKKDNFQIKNIHF